MDPLSITTGVVALIGTTYQIIKYGLDVKEAPKEIMQLKDRFEALHTVLGLLRDRCKSLEEKDPDRKSPWLRSLWDLRITDGFFDPKDGYRWHPGETKPKGALEDLRRKIDDIGEKLNPSKKWENRKLYKLHHTHEKLAWPFKKSDFPQMFSELDYCLSVVNTIYNAKNDASLEELQGRLDEFAAKHDEALKETLRGFEQVQDSLSVLNARNESSFGLVLDGVDETKLAVLNLDAKMSDMRLQFSEEQERRERAEFEAEKAKIIKWLSPLAFIDKRKQLLADCFTETGQWLWVDERFRAWTRGGRRSWFLRCRGNVGVGKTVLSSILMHHVQCNPKDLIPVLFLYLDYKSSSTQTVPALVGSLLKQLLQIDQDFEIPEELIKVYKQGDRYEHSASSYGEEMQKILKNVLAERYERFYIIVDGFDELLFSERQRLLNVVRNLCDPNGGLAITMRPTIETIDNRRYTCSRCGRTNLSIAYHCRICRKGEWDLCFDCNSKELGCLEESHILREEYDEIEIRVQIPDGDIENYVKWEFGLQMEAIPEIGRDERDTASYDSSYTSGPQDFFQEHPELRQEVVAKVTEKANGNFLFARLYMDALKNASNVGTFKKVLRKFPADFSQVYEQAMKRIVAQSKDADRVRGIRVLGLIALARRPLSLKELQHAVAVLSNDLDDDDDISEFVDEPKHILGSTAGLIIFENQETDVRLVHRSLEEFFFGDQDKNLKKWLPNAEKEVAQACMRYLDLTLPQPSEDKVSYAEKGKTFPFLAYASQYWGDHVRDAMSGESKIAFEDSSLSMLNNSDRRDACMQAAWETSVGGLDTWDVRRGVHQLHICAWYGLSTILSALSPDASTVDRKELKYRQTPLMYACRRGHVEVVRYLLSVGASQRVKSVRGKTALFEAILSQNSVQHIRRTSSQPDNDKVVELLIAKSGDLDINSVFEPEFDRTALMLAAHRGKSEMVKILLEHPEINVDLQDRNGYTALALAVREDHIEVVRMLLHQEASINLADFQVGRSPLRLAAERNLPKMVELLLSSGADADLRDRHGGTAVLRAVNRDARLALETMIEKKVNLQCVDETGQSLLHGAAFYGYVDTLRILLDENLPRHQILKPDVRDHNKMTPLHQACRRSYEKARSKELDFAAAEVITVLLDHGADASLVDAFSRTPLTIARQYGSEKTVELLGNASQISDSDVSLDAKNLPIWAMARQGLTDLVQRTLQTGNPADIDLEPITGNTCLSCAAEMNHLDVLSAILSFNLIDVNATDTQNRTALHNAALLGHEDVVRLLIEAGADVNVKDRWDDEPLVLAQSNERFEIMVALVGGGRARIDTKKINLTQLFFYAVENGHTLVVTILLEEYGVDRSVQNGLGLNALQIARVGNDEFTVRALLAAPTMSVGVGGSAGAVRSDKRLGMGTGTGAGEGDGFEDEGIDMSEVPFKPFRAREVLLDDEE